MDAEDIALSAFDSLYRGIQACRYPQLLDRGDPWRLLVITAARKVLSQFERDRRKKRGGGNVRGESALDHGADSDSGRGIEQVVGEEPSPELALLVAEEYESLLSCLDNENLRVIATKKLEGWSNEDISGQLRSSLRTVERRLQMVRAVWSRRLEIP